MSLTWAEGVFPGSTSGSRRWILKVEHPNRSAAWEGSIKARAKAKEVNLILADWCSAVTLNFGAQSFDWDYSALYPVTAIAVSSRDVDCRPGCAILYYHSFIQIRLQPIKPTLPDFPCYSCYFTSANERTCIIKFANLATCCTTVVWLYIRCTWIILFPSRAISYSKRIGPSSNEFDKSKLPDSQLPKLYYALKWRCQGSIMLLRGPIDHSWA